MAIASIKQNVMYEAESQVAVPIKEIGIFLKLKTYF